MWGASLRPTTVRRQPGFRIYTSGMQRRRFLSALAAGAAALSAPTIPAKSPESDELEQYDLRLDGDPKLARRALLFVPKHVVKSSRLPLLVLLHGLGETGNELSGIHAWGDL